MTERPPYRDSFEHLADELRRLDLCIQLRLASARLRNEAVPDGQTTRAVYISRAEVDWMLAADTDEPGPQHIPAGAKVALAALSTAIEARVSSSEAAGVRLALPALGRRFGLSGPELFAVVACLAPELRRKYDRLYAYLQDDITRRRPSVDLILELLYDTEPKRWAARGYFAATAPLLHAGILRTVEDPQSPSGSSGLAQFLALDQRILRFLQNGDELDAPLVGHVRVHPPIGGSTAEDPVADGLCRLAVHHLAREGQKLILHVRGPAGAGKSELVRKTTARLGMPLVSVDLAALAALGARAEVLLRLAFREALLRRAAVHLAAAHTLLRPDSRTLLAAFGVAVADFGRLVLLTGEASWLGHLDSTDAVFHSVDVALPDPVRSAAIWQTNLAGHPQQWATELAGRYRLPAGRIPAAARLAENQRLMRSEPAALTLADLSAACRQQSNQTLGELATRVRVQSGWDDLVLPADRTNQLREICAQVRHHHQVFGQWGFGAKLGHGKGLSVLFSGPPGTGKTMAAGVLAADLELDLYKVDLSGVVSKYIGETEKNLARVFAEARTSNSILFFDEADALFGKRTEVSDAHDRYANIETSYLLQQMEEYDGVVVLATNLRQNLDEAFLRRIRFVVEFPFPDAESRARIWQAHVPAQAPVAADIDFDLLARKFPVPGGNIKNIMLNAAFLAASNGGVIDGANLLRGTRREFEKIGKLWNGEDDPS